MKRLLMLLAVFLLAVALVLPSAASATPEVKAEPNYVPDELIVKFKPGIAGQAKSSIHAQEEAKVVSRNHAVGLEVVKLEKGQSVQKAIQAYEKNPNVEYAEPNYIVKVDWTPNDPAFSTQQWGPQRIQAPRAWDITRSSSNIRIAVIDTGVQYNHPDLSGKVIRGYNFVERNWNPYDGNGHGTHVAGIAAAITNNGIGMAGMAPNARIFAVRVLNNSGSGTLANVVNGITHAADNGSHVINLSLGSTSGASSLESAVNYAWNRGSVVVAAAGNAGNTSPHYPAYYANALSVAATTSSDAKAWFSTYGTWVDVAAPGHSIYSTFPTNTYRSLSGTSMAAPHVAGLAGLLAAQGRSNSQIRTAIQNSADRISGTGFYWRYGRVNAYRAVTY
ncbi:thermitase [Desmospora profundinema]|uniref:Thermitase n=2 Tax=Desmospora profundinema TaxID=1571184 RepID=A0ABU1IQ32_9BACL|nr:thermitase [Desmospora profundinema]